MSSRKSTFKLITICLVIFIVGGIAGAVGIGYQYQTIVLPYFGYDYAHNAASSLDILSMLRLNETEEAIQVLEKKIDTDVLYMASDVHGSGTDYSRAFLSRARIYRDHYPSPSKNTTRVSNAAKVLEDYLPVKEFKCEGPLRRLLEQAQTNEISGN